MFLKGLYLSFFEGTDLNHANYRIDGDAGALRKRNVHHRSAISSSHFPAMRNYNKLVVDFSKIAQYDETKDILYRNNDATKAMDNSVNNGFKDAYLIHPTLTIGTTATQSTSSTEKHDTTNNNAKQPFLIQVY